MRIAVIDALEIHPSERAPRKRPSPMPAAGQPLLSTLLRDLAVAVVTSAACLAVIG